MICLLSSCDVAIDRRFTHLCILAALIAFLTLVKILLLYCVVLLVLDHPLHELILLHQDYNNDHKKLTTNNNKSVLFCEWEKYIIRLILNILF